MAFDSIKLVKELVRQEIFVGLANVPGTSRLLVGASDGNVYDVDPLAENAAFKVWPGHTSYVTGVAVASGNFVSGGYDCQLIFRRLEGDETLREIPNAHTRWIRKIVASPDGRLVASVADDMVCRLWDAASGELVRELRGHEERIP